MGPEVRWIAVAGLAAVLGGGTAAVAAAETERRLARPTPEQVEWQDMEVEMFLCLDPATWQDREYDDHSTPLDRIDPARLDTDQWARAAVLMGAKQILFVAKHTGGFCWWQTETSDYGVRQIPWRGGKGDVVRDLSESCRKHGLKLALYLSPQDDRFGAGGAGRCRDAEAQERYDAVYRRQWEELLGRYGPIAEVWFDGSCAIEVGDILRKHAPKAMVFQGPHATIRWVGNEEGHAPYPMWNAVSAADARSGVATAAHGNPDGDTWLPCEVNTVNVVPHYWFWKSTPDRRLKTLDELMDCYYRSVGHGGVFLLNQTPDTSGLIPEPDIEQCRAFGEEIRRRFGRCIAETRGEGDVIDLNLGRPAWIDHVISMERIEDGERVREYAIEGLAGDRWEELCRGSAIGHKKIDRFPLTEVRKVRLRVLKAAATPLVRRLAAFRVFGEKISDKDTSASGWRIDPEGIVVRNDVLYSTPSPEPWEAMPTGGGDLSAMVRWDGTLRLHLGKSDAWGFQTPADAPQGNRFFTNVSPGHVRLDLGERGREAAARGFSQRLDLYRGQVVIHLGGDGGVRLSVWGHPDRKILIMEVDDPGGILGAAKVDLSEWRPAMRVGHTSGILEVREIIDRPARPHLANTGMEDFFPAGKDPLLGRGIAVALASPAAAPASAELDGLTASLHLPDRRPSTFHLVIAAAVTASGDPLAAARRELEEAAAIGIETLRAEQRAWWREHWGRSFLRIESPDRAADRLCTAYHVHLYTLGCVNRGPCPAKWDGGPGLMRGDERNWGLSEWVQEIRFTYMPLYAANRLEMARGLTRHYSAMVPYLEEQTRRMWGLPGIWIPETTLPWGHAEDFILKDDGRGTPGGHFQRRDPARIPYGRFDYFNAYVGFLFTAGLEICHHYILYHRYSGDETFLRDEAYPVLRGVVEFIASLLRKEADGRFHLDPANALETWWLVRDPEDTLSGIRAVFPEFVRLSESFGRDEALRARCREILAALPEPSLGHWGEDGAIDPKVDVYAPAAARGASHPRTNCENPGLYRVFPFGLSGIDTPDYDRAKRTFDRRICILQHGWSMDALWAARLGLGDEACRLAARHAEEYNRYRYGGWRSNDNRAFPGGLSSTPFLDAGGLSAAAIQEILLQDHGGVIRVAPAVARDWSGIFKLRAQGGFLVSADIAGGMPRFIEIRSLWGRACTIANPWPGGCVVREGGAVVTRGDAARIRFPTRSDGIYLIEPQE